MTGWRTYSYDTDVYGRDERRQRADGNGQPLAADPDQSETTYQLRTVDLARTT